MLKHTKSLLIICAVFTALNFIYLINSYRYNSKLIQFDDDRGYSLVNYHQGSSNHFIVAQKYYTDDDRESELDYLWDIVNSEVGKSTDYDIKIIEGYDYKELERLEHNQEVVNKNFTDVYKVEYEVVFAQSFIQFFIDLLALIEQCKPNMDSINNNEHYLQSKIENKYPNNNGKMMIYGGHLRENYLDEPIRTKEMLSSYLRLSTDEANELRRSHELFMRKMPVEFPEDLLEFNKFNRFMKGDGIVYLGGDKYNQLVLLSIKLLRSNGSKLPIEVILPRRDDFDIDLCTNILPKFNANCKIMADYLPESFMDKITGYQMKNVALLISSFRRILYLDADNLPIKNPDVFFNNKPFTNKHLVIWPDLWRRSTSPNFYDIANIDVDTTWKVRNSYFSDDPRGKSSSPLQYSFHDCKGSIPEASSETGQILIDKKIHLKTLILSMYYNWYGPDFYYPLFSQGAAGEGDKETFIAAAHKLDLPYYQVKEFNREFGPINEERNRHEFFGMGQYDPIIDYIQSNEDQESADKENPANYYTDEEASYGNSDIDRSKNNYKYHLFKSSSLFFLHANWPKYNLHEMFLLNSYGRGPKEGDSRRRLYNRDLINELNDYDFELEINKNLKWCFCDLINFDLKGVPKFGTDDRKRICEEINSQIKFLEKN